MIRLRLICTALLTGLAIMPAAAADRAPMHPYMIEEAPPPMAAPVAIAASWSASPFYLVNQGPELSGPGIMITRIGLTRTDLRRSYPFIGTLYADHARFAVQPDYYGVYPTTIYTAPRIETRTVRRKRVRRAR